MSDYCPNCNRLMPTEKFKGRYAPSLTAEGLKAIAVSSLASPRQRQRVLLQLITMGDLMAGRTLTLTGGAK